MANPKIIATVGLSFGDEGKGTIVDYLTREYDAKLIVRFSGGPQAAHNVIEPGGRHHTFSQFGSGSLVPGVTTYLAPGMAVTLPDLVVEALALENVGLKRPMERLRFSPECLLVTPLHTVIGRIREALRGPKRHGSAGMGVGTAFLEARENPNHALRMKDLLGNNMKAKIEAHWQRYLQIAQGLVTESQNPKAKEILERLLGQPFNAQVMIDHYDWFASNFAFCYDEGETIRTALKEGQTIILEGSQGTLIDYDYGFYPHVTKTSTTLRLAEELIASWQVPKGYVIRRIGLLRSHMARHGAGPLVTEGGFEIKDPNNVDNEFQGQPRYGIFDLVATKYALSLNPTVQELAVTHLDALNGLEEIPVCLSYQYMGKDFIVLDRNFFWQARKGKIEITGFKGPRHRDESQKEEITKILFDSKPLVIKALPSRDGQEEFLEFLESELGLPVTIRSFGPTWTDKESKKPAMV